MIVSQDDDDDDEVRYDKKIIYLTILCLIFHLLTNMIHPICYFFAHISQNPRYTFISYLLWDMFWSISKMSLYAVFTYRLYMAFKDTIFEYSKYTIFIPLGLAWLLQTILLISYFILFYTLSIPTQYEHIFIIISCTIFAFLDFVLCAVILYLFTNGIVKLVINMKQRSLDYASQILSARKDEAYFMSPVPVTPNADDEADEDEEKSEKQVIVQKKAKKMDVYEWNIHQHELLKTATHLTLLGVIAMLSSFVYQVLWLVRFSIDYHRFYYLTNTWSIDIIINIICLYLSMAIARDVYHFICVKCCKLHQLCFMIVECIAMSRDLRINRNKVKEDEKRKRQKGRHLDVRDIKDEETEKELEVLNVRDY